MKDLSAFEEKIKVTFADKNLLKQAFIHRSYINENAKVGLEHNERLEFWAMRCLNSLLRIFFS